MDDDKIKDVWYPRAVGITSLFAIYYFSTWQLALSIAVYHVAHVMGRHKGDLE